MRRSAPALPPLPRLETTAAQTAGDASGRAWDGVVEAVQQATLTTQTTGRVTAVNADVKDRVAGVLLDWAEQFGIDEAQLTIDIDGFVDRYHGVPLGQLDLAGMLLEVTALLRSHQLALPADLALLIKVCLTLEGLGRSLDPDFEMARQAQPFLRRAMAAQLGPRAVARRGARAWTDAVGLIATLPRELRRLLRGMRGDGPRVHMEIDELKEFGRQVAHSANRLAGSMVIAALIVGSSITMTVKGGPALLGLPFFGLLGFIGAAFAGMWLLWSIFRSGGGR